MQEPEYGLGVEIGDASVVAAVMGVEDDSTPRELVPLTGRGTAWATASVLHDGTIAVGPAGGPDTTTVGSALAHLDGQDALALGERVVPAADVLAAVIEHVRTVAEEREGSAPAWTVVALPPSIGEAGERLMVDAVERFSGPVVTIVPTNFAVLHHISASGLPSDGGPPPIGRELKAAFGAALLAHDEILAQQVTADEEPGAGWGEASPRSPPQLSPACY